MKLFIISNTEFGHKNHKYFIDYFNKDFIPYIKKLVTNNDIFLHTGGMFYNKSFNMTTVGVDVYKIFDEISNYLKVKLVVSEKDMYKDINSNTLLMFNNHPNIEIVKEQQKFDNFDIVPNISISKLDLQEYIFYNQSFIHNNKKNKFVSPYQLDEKDENKKVGFYICETENFKFSFVENKYTKRYTTIEISNNNELINLKEEHFNNNVHLKIDQNFYEENQNKINVILSKFNVSKTSFIQQKDDEYSEEITNLENSILTEIKKTEDSDLLLKEFTKILDIYKNRLS